MYEGDVMRNRLRTIVYLSLVLLFGRVAVAFALAPGLIENRGQLADEVLYYAPGTQGTIYFLQEAVVFDLWQESQDFSLDGSNSDWLGSPLEDYQSSAFKSRRSCALWMRFVDPLTISEIDGEGKLSTKLHFFFGDDPSGWQTDVPVFSRVVYRNLWDGIDISFDLDSGQLRYVVTQKPEADPDNVQFIWEGAEQIVPSETSNDLVITSTAKLVHSPSRSGDGVGRFFLAKDDRESSCIFPSSNNNARNLLWSVLLGEGLHTIAYFVTLDTSGDLIIGGHTINDLFPTTPGAYDQTFNGGRDAIFAKLDAATGELLWATFLGGSSDDFSFGVSIDPAGNLVVAGQTQSPDFPVAGNAYDDTHNGSTDVYVAKFDASGSQLLWSTFIGGSESEHLRGLALDQSGVPHVTGYTVSDDYPTTPGAFDPVYEWPYPPFRPDIFVTKLLSDGSDLIWSTYLGASETDYAHDIAVDGEGNVYVTGWTQSTDFPTTPGAHSETFNGGTSDAILTKFDVTGSSLLWSTFLGGLDGDHVREIALDLGGDPVVIGATRSFDFPVTDGVFDSSHNGVEDIFVTKFSGQGGTISWSTLIGGERADRPEGLFLGLEGNILITGYTISDNFPVTFGAFDSTHNGDADAFLLSLEPAAEDIQWSTLLGGVNQDVGMDTLLDFEGNPIVVGRTSSPDFPADTTGFYTEEHIFVTSFDVEQVVPIFLSRFSVAYRSGGVDIEWEIAQVADPNSFLLESTCGGSDRVIPFEHQGNNVFVARDDRPFTTDGGTATYSLFYLAPNGGWQLLVSRTVDREVPLFAVGLKSVHPNPFNPQTTISFSLERDEWAEVGVYELTGRRVTELASREFTAGNHSLLWNGRDSHGRAMPSGTYVVRLESESGVEARKVLLLR
jgi:hypothetical protein